MSVSDRADLFFTEIAADPGGIIARTAGTGLKNAELAEIAAWAWEMAAQVEHIAASKGIPCVFMGGGGAQLRFDIGVQRGSRDADFMVRATAEQVTDLIVELQERLSGLEDEPIFIFRRFTPRGPVKRLAMVRWDTWVPNTATRGAPHLIKLEFQLRTDALPASEAVSSRVFVFGQPVTHRVPRIGYQVALKLMTITSEPAGGVPRIREAVLPRQFYDLDQLFATISVDEWGAIADGIADLARRETPTVHAIAVWEGIRERLNAWTDGLALPRGPQASHIAAYNGEVPNSQQIPLAAWRTRLRRLAFAARCAEDKIGAGSTWAFATGVASQLTGRDRDRLAKRWRAERGANPPDLTDRRPEALWWEYLVTGGAARWP